MAEAEAEAGIAGAVQAPIEIPEVPEIPALSPAEKGDLGTGAGTAEVPAAETAPDPAANGGAEAGQPSAPGA